MNNVSAVINKIDMIIQQTKSILDRLYQKLLFHPEKLSLAKQTIGFIFEISHSVNLKRPLLITTGNLPERS